MPRIRKFRGQDIDIALEQVDVVCIQDKTPVVTGDLKKGFKLDSAGRIVNEVYYGDYVERGTTKMGPRFMVARAIPEIADRMIRKVGKQLDEIKLLDLPKKR